MAHAPRCRSAREAHEVSAGDDCRHKDTMCMTETGAIVGLRIVLQRRFGAYTIAGRDVVVETHSSRLEHSWTCRVHIEAVQVLSGVRTTSREGPSKAGYGGIARAAALSATRILCRSWWQWLPPTIGSCSSSWQSPKKGFWGCPSGFIECGESPEEACLRELWEEAGVTGEIVRLVRVMRRGTRNSMGTCSW